jgi:hypothetical protein
VIRVRVHARALAAAIILLALVGAGATAFWTAPGSGSTRIVLPDPQLLSFTLGTPTAQLFPGDDASVAIVASNPNPYFLTIGSMELDPSQGAPFAVDMAHSGCDVSALSFVTQDNNGQGWQVPPRVGSTDGRLTIDMASAMRMSATAASACQGATFTVRLVARD